jgi:tyrosyl-tRNA synthetase
MKTIDAIEASGLFESKTEIRKAMNNKAIKINGQVVDNLEETIEHGDFLNFVWFCGGADWVKEHGPIFLAVSAGKKAVSKVILKVEKEKLVVVA